MKMLGAHNALLFAMTAVPLLLFTTPMRLPSVPRVRILPGLVLLDRPIRPISGRYDEFEKSRAAWSSGRCSLYWPEMKKL
jgi:hypothetical protein